MPGAYALSCALYFARKLKNPKLLVFGALALPKIVQKFPNSNWSCISWCPNFPFFLIKVLIWAISWALKGALPLIFFSYCQTYSIFSKSEKWKRIFQTIRPIPFSRHVRSGVGCSVKNYALPWIVRRREEQAEEIPLTGVQKCAYDTWVTGHASYEVGLLVQKCNKCRLFFSRGIEPADTNRWDFWK